MRKLFCLTVCLLLSLSLLLSGCQKATTQDFLQVEQSFTVFSGKTLDEALAELGSSQEQATEVELGGTTENGVHDLHAPVTIDGFTFDRYVDITLSEPHDLTGIWYVASLPATEENLQKLVQFNAKLVKEKGLEYDERLLLDKMNKRQYSLQELTTLEEMAASEDASVSYGESWTVQEDLELGLYVKRVGDALYQIVKVHSIVRPS